MIKKAVFAAVSFMTVAALMCGCILNNAATPSQTTPAATVQATPATTVQVTTEASPVQPSPAESPVAIRVYVNEKLVETITEINEKRKQDYTFYFVELKPVFEALGAKVEQKDENTTLVWSKKLGYFKFVTGDKTYVYSDQSFSTVTDEYENSILAPPHMYQGKLMFEFTGIRLLIDGGLKQDGSDIYLYSKDFVRKDIPATLQECYKELDKRLSEEDKQTLKNSKVDELAQYHFSLGLWIRNNWIYPTENRIAKIFVDKGIRQADDMSGIIIVGYYYHLNGKDMDLDELLEGSK